MPEEELKVTIPARLSEVRELSSMVEAFGDANGLPDPKVFVINLALDELITNTVTHGLEDKADAEIQIRMRVHADTLTVVMEDNGQPFDPTQETGRRRVVVAGGTRDRRTRVAPGEELRRPRFLRVRGRQESPDDGARPQAAGLTPSISSEQPGVHVETRWI